MSEKEEAAVLERPRKRHLEPESDDSFDAPVEFVQIGVVDAKKTKFSYSPTKSPLKQSNTPLKRSPKIVIQKAEEENVQPEEYVVSDWDSSPENSVIEKPEPPALTSTAPVTTPFASQDSQESDPIRLSPRRVVEEGLERREQAGKKYYLDTLLEQKSDVSGIRPHNGLAAFSNSHVPLQVVEVRRPGEEVHHLICRNLDGEEVVVYLQDLWEECHIDEGMEIRLIDADTWGEKDYIVSNAKGFLIVEPDLLLTSTATAGASWCQRKVVLNHRVKGPEGANKSMLIGCIMHELFQLAVQHPQPSTLTTEWLFEHWRADISSHVVEALVALKFSPKAFETELVPYADVIVSWVRGHMSGREKMPTEAKIVGVQDIEENIWDPVLGLKGKVDTTLKVNSARNAGYMEPLELKTGKSGVSVEHSCQVLLYSMMLSARYNQPMMPGSLLYLKDGTKRAVVPKAAEIQGIVQQRNSLAYYLSQKDHTRLPEPKTDPMFCGKCDQAMSCVLYQARAQSSVASPQFKEFVRTALAHLSQKEMDYFHRWTDGLFNEYLAEKRNDGQKQSDLWKIDPEEREKNRQCLSSMSLLSIETLPAGSVRLTFSRVDRPFDDSILKPGTSCTISLGDKFGLAICPVLESSDSRVVLRCERKFGFLKEGSSYELDVYNSFSSFANTMGSVLLLMGGDPVSSRLRSLVINLSEPAFLSASDCPFNPDVLRLLQSSRLNRGQRGAIERSLLARDYSLIEGLPGAGKTTTIAVLIRCLVLMGQSVLLTSYTNSAVDTVICKLLENVPGKQILRLGRTSPLEKIATLNLANKLETQGSGQMEPNELYEATRRILRDTPIVACTCYHSSREVLLSWRQFDVCIVDEASMVLEPVVMPALFASKKFVMVGDTKQLAPLVLHKESRSSGLNMSLFERLQVHESAVSSLTEQFRMNQSIASLSSRLFYDGRLVCANSTVAGATIRPLCNIFPENIDAITSSAIEDSCIWVDVPAVELVGAAHTVNEREVRAVETIVGKFKELGVAPEQIGIMCTYNAQVEALRSIQGVEVNTVDQYQGRDKPIILWSLVWTSQSQKRCELLYDDRRINVALTRAKQKLIIVGCVSSMQNIPTMSNVIPLTRQVSL